MEAKKSTGAVFEETFVNADEAEYCKAMIDALSSIMRGVACDMQNNVYKNQGEVMMFLADNINLWHELELQALENQKDKASAV